MFRYVWLRWNVLAVHSCITNLGTFQHGHPGYLGALQKTSALNDTCCSYESYFLNFKNDKIRKKPSDFRYISISQNCLKASHIPSVSLCCAACSEGIHYWFIQILSFHVTVETRATIKFCVKLGMAFCRQMGKITAAHMNYKVCKRLIF